MARRRRTSSSSTRGRSRSRRRGRDRRGHRDRHDGRSRRQRHARRSAGRSNSGGRRQRDERGQWHNGGRQQGGDRGLWTNGGRQQGGDRGLWNNSGRQQGGDRGLWNHGGRQQGGAASQWNDGGRQRQDEQGQWHNAGRSSQWNLGGRHRGAYHQSTWAWPQGGEQQEVWEQQGHVEPRGAWEQQGLRFSAFARTGQLAKQQAKHQARPPPEPTTDEDLYDSGSLPLQDMSDSWDVAMANARSDPFRVPCVQEAKVAGQLLPLRVPPASEIGEFAQGLATFMPQSPPSILHNAATVLLAAECSIDASAEVQAFSWKGPGVEAHFVPTSPLNAWYRELDATSRDSHVWGHSTHWTSAPYILREGCVRPQSWRQGAADAALGEPELPTTGFFCQASQGALTEWGIKQAAGKVLKMARASCGPIIIGIINHAPNHATVEGGGNWKIQACARTAGLCRGPDSYCARRARLPSSTMRRRSS